MKEILKSKTLSSTNDYLAIPCSNLNSIGLTMSTTGVSGQTSYFEVCNDAELSEDGVTPKDGTGNWVGILATRTDSGAISTIVTLSSTPTFGWVIPLSGWRFFRIRLTGISSGSITWSVFAKEGSASPIGSTATGTVNIGTMPSIPAGTNSIGTVVTNGPNVESAVVTGNATRVGGRVRTANLTTFVADDASDLHMTTAGQLLVKDGGLTESSWNSSSLLTSTTAVALAGTAGAGLKRHLTDLQMTNTTATDVEVFILDGATERWRFLLKGNASAIIQFKTSIIVTANTAININLSAANAVRVCAQGYTAP